VRHLADDGHHRSDALIFADLPVTVLDEAHTLDGLLPPGADGTRPTFSWSTPLETAGESPVATPPATPPVAVTAVVYLTIANDGCLADRLIGATTDVAEIVEIRESVREGDLIESRPRADGLEIPAGGTARLDPEGDHLMLIGVREELPAGGSFILTLTFEFNGEVPVSVVVHDGVEPPAEEAFGAPVTVGTIRVATAWARVTTDSTGAPVAAGTASERTAD
jgi:copper(I)-binding protein